MLGKYIKRYRTEKKLTQVEFINKMQSADSSFSSLDEITVSRWENGKTRPTMRKQILLLMNMGYLSEFNNFITPNKKKIEELLSKRYKECFAQCDNPYAGKGANRKIYVRSYDKFPESRTEFYKSYLTEIHKVSVNDEDISRLNNNLKSLSIHEFYTSTEFLLGHFVYFNIENDFTQYLLQKKLNTDYQFDKNNSIYIMSLYAVSKKIFYYQCKIIIEAVLRAQNRPKYFYVKCFFPEMIKYYEAIGGEVCFKGPECENGVKYYSSQYRWLMYRMDIVDVLASKLFYVDEELINDYFIIEGDSRDQDLAS